MLVYQFRHFPWTTGNRVESTYLLYGDPPRDRTENLRIKSHHVLGNKAYHNKEWLARFMAERKSRSLSSTTIQFYTTYLTPFMDSIKGQALDVTKEDIAQFLDSLSCSPGGKHAYFRAIRAFYRWAWEEGYTDAIPRMKAPKVPKPLRY